MKFHYAPGKIEKKWFRNHRIMKQMVLPWVLLKVVPVHYRILNRTKFKLSKNYTKIAMCTKSLRTSSNTFMCNKYTSKQSLKRRHFRTNDNLRTCHWYSRIIHITNNGTHSVFPIKPTLDKSCFIQWQWTSTSFQLGRANPRVHDRPNI